MHCIAASSERTVPFQLGAKALIQQPVAEAASLCMYKLPCNCRSLSHICRWHQAVAYAWSKRLTSQSRAHLLWCLTFQQTLLQTGHASMSGHQCRGQSFQLLLSPCVTGIHSAQQQPNRLTCVVLLVRPVHASLVDCRCMCICICFLVSTLGTCSIWLASFGLEDIDS